MDTVNKAIKSFTLYLRERLTKDTLVPLVKRALIQLAAGLLCAALSGVKFFGGTYPFGLAFVVGASDRFAIASLVGFIVGNWTSAEIASSSTYIAAAGVVAATRWILAATAKNKYRKSNFIPCLVAGLLSVTISELAIMSLTLSASFSAVLTLVGGVSMSGAFSYFYRTVFDAFKKRRSLTELSSVQKASLALVLCSAIMALYPIAIGPFSLGRLSGIIISIFAAYLLSSPLEASVFAAVAAAFIIQEPAFAFASAGICVAGSLASLFRNKSRGALCFIFIITSTVLAFCTDGYIYSITFIAEIMFGSLVFLVTPLKNMNSTVFSLKNESVISATSAVSYKLDCISTSMQDITTLLDKTVKIHDERPNTEKLLSATVDKVCRSCPVMSYCWVKCYGDTVDSLNKLVPILLSKSEVTKNDLSPSLKSRCVNAAVICREINTRYSDHVQSVNKIKTTQLYKSILKKQFSAICEMLSSAKDELSSLHDWDEEKSKRIYDCAVRLGLPIETAGCIYDVDRRPLITVALSDAIPENLIKRLTAGISLIVGSTLSSPNVEMKKVGVTLNYTEKPMFAIKTATAQISADNKMCGDVFSVFSDSKFNVHIVMSDGMGTGQTAARDGALCCAFLKRLLESGFRIKRAAELANAALALREDSETASTLDALTINVFTGEATLFKAGASATYFLHSNKIKRIEGKTLPVGILNTVTCKEVAVELEEDDIIVMTSDGAEIEDNMYIEQTIKNMYSNSVEEICKALIAQAEAQNLKRDDITVIVARIEKTPVE